MDSKINIEKYEIDAFKKEQIPFDFTILPNIVLQNFTHESLSLWVHLQSLPPTWVVNREYIMKKFLSGRDKINAWLKTLNDNFLIRYERTRAKNGTLSGVTIIVCNGLEYYHEIIKNPREITTPLKSRVVVKSADFTTPLKNHTLDKPRRGKSAPINKTIKTKQKVETKKTKSFYEKENEKKHDFADSMNQMASESKNIRENEKHKSAQMPDELRDFVKNIGRGIIK